MKMTKAEFLGWPHKAITLLGMSGVGKTRVSATLPHTEWFHYSGDYRIGTKYLSEPILDNIKRQAMQVGFLRDLLRSDSIYIASNITIHNLTPVASFLGKIGRPDLGGLPVDEFKKRQRLHRDAEIGEVESAEDDPQFLVLLIHVALEPNALVLELDGVRHDLRLQQQRCTFRRRHYALKYDL